METLNLFAYSCPSCKASDRSRLYALFFDEELRSRSVSAPFELVDFAPEAALASYLRAIPNVSYRSADLLMDDVDDTADLTDLHMYADDSKDAFVCSHLLEHVPDDRKAMSELFRILKPGGFGIAMVPIALTMTETHEDPSVVSKTDRWKYYGQDDHVRAYAKSDFVSRLSEAGFDVEQLGATHFGKETFKEHGIHPRSVLYVVRKSS